MVMKKLVFDVESNGFVNDATTVWCISTYDIVTKETITFSDNSDECPSVKEGLDFLANADELIGHNIIMYDIPLLQKLFKFKTKARLIDTFLMSQLLNFNRTLGRYKGRHGLEMWGEHFGVLKPSQGQWLMFEKSMLNRCEQDVLINVRVFHSLLREFKESGVPKEVLNREFKIAKISAKQVKNGWLVDRDLADKHIAFLTVEIDKLKDKIEPLMPPIIKCPDFWISNAECNTILKTKGVNYQKDLVGGKQLRKPVTPKWTKAGKLHKHIQDWFEGYDCVDYINNTKGLQVNGPYCRVEITPAKLTQTAEVKKLLFKHGWKPTEWNTKRAEDGSVVRTSAKLTEDSYNSIQGDLGQEIALHAVYQHRRNTLQNQKNKDRGWLGVCRDDGRLECVPFTLGTATGRMSHRNLVNVPGAKAVFGKEMRSIFIAPENKVLVGCDLASAQLRLLASAMGDPRYVNTVTTGKEEDGTDVHTVNQKAAGLKDRSQAKTFIYGFLFGASAAKLGTIGGGKSKEGTVLKTKFLRTFPLLKKLQDKLIGEFNRSGNRFITAQDGRKIQVDSEHKLLNYLLQGNEAILAKEWAIVSDGLIKKNNINCKLLAIMHDEQNFECDKKDADKLSKILEESAKIAGQRLGFDCPMSGNSKIGKTWYDIH
jgi:DNA polymerase I